MLFPEIVCLALLPLTDIKCPVKKKNIKAPVFKKKPVSGRMVKVVPLAPSTMQPGPGFCFDPGPSGRFPGGTPLMLCTSPRVFFQTCGNKFGSFSFGRWSILALPKGVSPSQSLLTSPQPEPFGVVLLFCLREWLSFFGESAAVQWEFVAANLLSLLTSV